MSCISSTSTAILVNGIPTSAFLPSRGIRQGDPISPYLFIMCLEYLNFLIQKEVQSGIWKPVNPGRRTPKFSHIFFADDLLLFSVVDPSSLMSVKSTLLRFSEISGLEVNLAKSAVIFSDNTPPQSRVLACNILNISEADQLGKYLGFPIRKGTPKRKDFEFLIDRINSKLASWKSNFLSKAGRLVLVKSSLQSLAPYYMQAHKIPKSIC